MAGVRRDPDTSRLKRAQQPVPQWLSEAIKARGLEDEFNQRPPYQRNDYIGWITRAKLPDTQQRRLAQMLDELKRGDVYMNMPWQRG